MSYQEIFSGGKIAPQFIPDAALNSVENPLQATLQAFNPAQLVKHSITGANVVEASVIQTENLALVPGSLQTAIRFDESIELATAKRLEFQAAGEVAVASGQSLTLGGTLVAPDVAVAAAPHAQVLGYNTVTGDIEYQAAAGGSVTNPLSANLDCAAFDLDAVGAVNFDAAGDITVPSGQSLTLGGTLIAPAVAVAAAPHANVLGYNTVTGDIEYQAAAGGGGVTNPLTADLDCANNDLDGVKQLNFFATGQINAAAGNDMNITCGVGSSLTLDAGSVGALLMNSAIPAVSLKPDTGFCGLEMNSTLASLNSGNKDLKLTLDGAANTVSLQTSNARNISINEAAELVSIQANFGVTGMALNGQFGGSAAIAANSNASIVLDNLGGGRCEVVAADSFRLTGANLQSATSSGASGQFLRIILNGTAYKLALEND